MFDEKGLIVVAKEDTDMSADDMMMFALEAGAEDFSDEEDSYEITTTPEDFSTVREAFEKEGIAMANAEVLIDAYVSAGFTKIHVDTSMKVNLIVSYHKNKEAWLL